MHIHLELHAYICVVGIRVLQGGGRGGGGRGGGGAGGAPRSSAKGVNVSYERVVPNFLKVIFVCSQQKFPLKYFCQRAVHGFPRHIGKLFSEYLKASPTSSRRPDITFA